MATFIDSSALPEGSVVIVYDIEAIGEVERPRTCHVWNIAAQVLGRDNLTFEQYVRPPVAEIPEPAHPKLFRVTDEFLASVGARPWAEVADFFWRWVDNLYQPDAGGVCVLVSHGNYRFDKPLFEQEHLRWNVHIPPNVLFFDTLHWFRAISRRESSYSLQSLYRKAFKAEIRNQHLAIYDVYALNRLIVKKETPLTGTAYQFGATPMVRIPSVGQHTERLLIERGGFSSVEALWHFYRSTNAQFVQLLVNRVGIMQSTAEQIAAYLRDIT